MNEFVAKKLGEVLAFSRVGSETMERGAEALGRIFGDALAGLSLQNKEHGDAAMRIAEAAGVMDTVEMKLEGTGAKLRSMRDIYVSDDDDWSNPAELLEWTGFFSGAALVHWKLVLGAAEELGDEKLRSLASDGTSFHETMLLEAGSKLAKVGAERSRE